MAEESKQPDQAQFAYPAATAADTVKVKKRDQQAATDWQDGEPEKSPLGKPQTIPVDAQGPPVVAPHAQVYGSRQAVPTQEYVAGQNFPFLSNYLKALPHYVDDLSRDFGSDIYERMMLDAQVYSSITLLMLSVLAEGIKALPAIDDKDDEDYPLAEEIAEFCGRCDQNLDFQPVEQVCWELLAGIYLGHKIGEKVYGPGQGEDKGKLVLKSIKVKPREATGFVVDAYMNVVGLLGLIPGQGFPVLVGSIVANPSVLPNLLPREKFVIFTYNPKNGDPRGNSLLRSIYTPWWLKQQVWPEYIRYLALHGSPSYIGFTPQDAVTAPPADSLGNPTSAPLITPEQAMSNALAQLRNHSAAAFPYGSEVMLVQAQGDGSPFRSAIETFDFQIVQGVLLQRLATMEGQHQARASSETHKDILDLPIAHVKQQLATTWRRDVYYYLTLYNYGEDAARRLTPKASFGGTEENDWHTDADSIAKLVTSKFLSPSQFAALDEKLGLPVRTDASLAEKEADQGMQIAGMKNAAAGGSATPSESPPAPKPGSKNKEKSPKDNNQTPTKSGKKQPGDNSPFSEDEGDAETLGFSLDDIKAKYRLTPEEELRAKALLRSLARIKRFVPQRRGAANVQP